ncbi:MAG TPA: hypothetical protein VGA67_01810, partial [Candidatus Dojkabacteria bacterium]
MFEPNQRIYHDKWKTEDNADNLRKLRKITDLKVPLASDVPESWSAEILALVKLWEGQHGIEVNTSSIFRSYNVGFFESLRNAYYDIKSFAFSKNRHKKYYIERAISRVKVLLIRKIFGKIINSYSKPMLRITQIKEKWGSLRVYYNVVNCANPKYVEDMIEYDIKRVGEELVKKGVYY